MTAEVAPRTTARSVMLDKIETLGDAMEAAQVLSQSDLVPHSLRGKPANVLLVYLNGRELGLTMAQSMRTIFSPGPGQIGIRSSLMLAKLREAKHDYNAEYSEDGNTCTFTLTRADTGKDYSASFSVDDAIAAGLVTERNGELVALSRDGKPLPWMTYRPDMLFSRAATRCVNRFAPEVTLGMEIIGPEGPREAEVTLDVPPHAGSTPAGGPSDPPVPAQHAEELAGLDAQGQAQASGQQPAGDGSRKPAPSAPSPAGSPATRAERAAVSRVLGELGLDPRKHLADAQRTLTMFCRRRITTSAEMTSGEVARLLPALASIEPGTGDGEPVVLLADMVSAWERGWFDDDPDDYTRETGRSEPL